MIIYLTPTYQIIIGDTGSENTYIFYKWSAHEIPAIDGQQHSLSLR